jgi:folate-binding Fe-S cluster repair protein YgfZ
MLLQGLITNDLRELGEKTKEGEKFNRVSLFTLFMHPKGKIITDAFIFKPRIYRQGRPIYLEN